MTVRRTYKTEYHPYTNHQAMVVAICPFCGARVPTCVQNLRSSGKRCACGALFRSAYAWPKGAKP